jgi:hypothetical protein
MISLHLKNSLIGGVIALEGDNLVVFYMISLHLKSDDKRGGLSRGGQFSSILYDLTASEI